MHVTVQKRTYVFVSFRNLVLGQDTEDNSRISHARDLDVVQIVIDSESLLKRNYKRMNTRAPRVDERAIDIKKQETFSRSFHIDAMTKSECYLAVRKQLKGLARASLAPQ